MIDDAMNRLSAKRGQQLPHAKLTEDDVRLIRELVAHREDLIQQARQLSAAKIAEKFDVHQRTIEKVINGYSWGHVA